MSRVFIIIDCSASIIDDDVAKVGQINDLTDELIRECSSAEETNVVIYGNNSAFYYRSKDNKPFYEIPLSKFGGRSNLGKAYELIKNTVDKEKLDVKDLVLALISDGEATDNYKNRLYLLDPDREASRIALSIGSSAFTTEKHAWRDGFAFKNGVRDREDFLEKVADCID